MIQVFTGEVTNADFTFNNGFSTKHHSHLFWFTLYSDEELTTPMTGAAGTATVYCSEDSYNFAEAASDSGGVIDLTAGDYDRPSAMGCFEQFKVTLADTTDTAYFKLTVRSFN